MKITYISVDMFHKYIQIPPKYENTKINMDNLK
jgi:hypothetical protein